MSTASIIPYQLRPHKAIDRNLMISILKKLDRYSRINMEDYRYVGFGAAFLDDFKIIHLELSIRYMDCLEMEPHAFSRQQFNNPYKFLNLFPLNSTNYINSADYKHDKNQFIWLDYVSPGMFRQQLKDIEMLAEKVVDLDILKFTFNAEALSFSTTHRIKGCNPVAFSKLIDFLKNDPEYELYLPDHVTDMDILDDFSILLRAMAIRAINRGLATAGNNLVFNHISSFTYKDGQTMTTLMGIICKQEDSEKILKESGLKKWEFYHSQPANEFIPSHLITVPVMTVSERVKIDKLIPVRNINTLASKLTFLYGTDPSENIKLLDGYCKFYKYLPYYSKVTY